MLKIPQKNLVISAVGDESLHKYWLSDNYNFDSYLIYYGNKKGYLGESTFYKEARGFKYHLIKDLLDQNPWIFDYRYIWLPDDDIHATTNEVNALFAFMDQFDLWVAQPSIMGWYGVDITLHQKGSIIRFTNWVEIMCPCFSSEALKKCKEVFKENKTGWSIETIWNVLLGHPRDKIAIIDDVVVTHTRAATTGDTYKNQVDPIAEANEVYYKWKLDREMEKDLTFGRQIDSDIYCSVLYNQLFKAMEGKLPKNQRFWPQNNLFEKAVKDIRA